MNLIFDCIKTFGMTLGGLVILLLVGIVMSFVAAVIVRLLALRRMKREFPL